jgi:hypothetical protein
MIVFPQWQYEKRFVHWFGVGSVVAAICVVSLGCL